MKNQSKSSPITTSEKSKQKKEVTLNLAHLLVLHAILKNAPKFQKKDVNLTNLIKDIVYIFELNIDKSKNEELKKMFNYKPILWQEEEADEMATNQDDVQTVQDEAKKEVEHTD